MASKKNKIQNIEAFIRVREILSKKNAKLGTTTLTTFIAMGLVALAFPAAVPEGIAALGIGAIGIFLDQVTQKNLSEKEILDGVQKILNDNEILKQNDFTSYMAPFYPKLLQINDTLDSFATKDDLKKEIDPLLPKLDEIRNKLDLLVTKEDLKNAVTVLKITNPELTENDRLISAQAKLSEMPLDHIPEPAVMPVGSRPPKFAPNDLFVGREEELKQIADWLKGNSAVAIGPVAAFSGMGGIGKTKLAVEFAHRYGQYFLGGVYWLDFSNQDNIRNEIAACSGLDVSIPLEQRVKKVLADWVSPLPRLIVFDNCEDKNLVIQWRPSTGGSRVIVTTREGIWGPDLGIKHLPLATLTRPQSLELLHRFRDDIPCNDPDLDALANELGDLPLALRMAGSYLNTYRHEISPSQYLAEILNANPIQHESLQNDDFVPNQQDLNVGKTFAISFMRLGNNDKDQMAQNILDRAACFAPGVWIPREALKLSLHDSGEGKIFAVGLSRLINLGLIEENGNGDIWIHRLVVHFNSLKRDLVAANNDVEEAIDIVVGNANNSGFPKRMEPILIHFLYKIQLLKEEDEKLYSDYVTKYAYYLQSVANYDKAKFFYDKALSLKKKLFGEDHPDTTNLYNNLGTLYMDIGDYSLAKQYYEKALEINIKIFGENHFYTAIGFNNLGGILKVTGNFPEAKKYYERALSSFKLIYGNDHPNIATTYNNLGDLSQTMGEFQEAKKNYEQSLTIRKKELGEEHPETSMSYHNLGYLHHSLGNLDEARILYEHALSGNKNNFGDEHPITATSYNSLGGLYRDLSNYSVSMDLYLKAFGIRKKTLGLYHPSVAISLNNIAFILSIIGRSKEAIPFFEKALEISIKVNGKNHFETAYIYDGLGNQYQILGDFIKAKFCISKALEIKKEKFGIDHQDVATSLNSMGILLDKMGDKESALLYYEQALCILESKLGQAHPDTKVVRRNIESIIKETNKNIPKNGKVNN